MAKYASKYIGAGATPSGWTKIGNIAVDNTGTGSATSSFTPGILDSYDTTGYVIVSDTTTAGLVGRSTGGGTGTASANTPTYWVTSAKTDDSFISLAKKLTGSQSLSSGSTAKTLLNNSGYWTSYIVMASLLLDTYTGAAGAYSLRKLTTTYTGSAIRVRRSSDNTEQDIGFDSNGDLNQSTLTSFVGSNDGFVVKWYDQSGNGKDAIQITAARQPQIVTSGVIETLSGKPCMTQSGWQGFNLQPSGWNPITSFNTLILVNEPNVGLQADSGPFFGNIVTVDAYWTRIVSYGLDGKAYMSYIGNGGTYNGASANKNIFYVNTRGGKLYMSFDNNSESDLGNWNASYNQVYTLFYDPQNGNRGFRGKYNELVIWAGDKSTNRVSINNDINSYYSIY